MKEILKKVENRQLLIEISKEIYDKKAAMAAAYKFTDRCYIYVNSTLENIIEIYFKAKESISTPLEKIAYEYCNELLDQQVRLDVEASYGNIRDLIVKQAFSPIENIEEQIKT